MRSTTLSLSHDLTFFCFNLGLLLSHGRTKSIVLLLPLVVIPGVFAELAVLVGGLPGGPFHVELMFKFGGRPSHFFNIKVRRLGLAERLLKAEFFLNHF